MKRIARRTVLKASAAMAAPWPLRARAQGRMRRVGLLNPWVDPGGPPPGAAAAWKKLGWVEGETLQIERRYAGWRMERMPELADELLRRQQAEVLLAVGAEAAAAAARLTTTVPIVFNWAYLPVECGLIVSYARPGRNCTGTAMNAGVEVLPKRLEFLRAVVPSARRLAFLSGDLGQFTLSGKPLDLWSQAADAAKALGFEHTIHTAKRIEDVPAAFAEAAAAHAQAANINGSAYMFATARVADFALRQRWATSTLSPELFDAGLLLYHGLSKADAAYMGARWLQLADQVLRGADVAEIPVELPTRFEFALNLKAARALGLTLPQSLLLRADRVVE